MLAGDIGLSATLDFRFLITSMISGTIRAGNVLFSLLGFAFFYSALLVADLYLLLKYIRLGPDHVAPQPAALSVTAAE